MRLCVVIGCGQRHYAKGFCHKHYNATPERKAYHKKYNISPKSRAYGVARRATPQNKLYMKIYSATHRKTDTMFRFKLNVRRLIQLSFQCGGFSKNTKTAKILGCSFRYAMERIGWFEGCHIHHVVPLETARTEEDVIRLNHYTNLVALTPERHREIHRLLP